MLSRKAKYGLMGALNLARHYERGPRLIAEIVEEEDLPRKFLEAILLELKNDGMLSSKKGKGGGYTLARPPEEIMVGHIVRTLDGPLAPIRCASTSAPMPCAECKDPATCGIRDVMRDVRNGISDILDRTSLSDVIRREEERKLKNNAGALSFEI